MKVVFPEPAMPMHRMTGGLLSPAAGAVVFAAVDISSFVFLMWVFVLMTLVVGDAQVGSKNEKRSVQGTVKNNRTKKKRKKQVCAS
jgi:hypothetical protein